MNNTSKILLGLFIVFAFLGLVFASEDNETGNDKKGNETSAKNMTYGQCVSENAKVKNTCYASAKNVSIECNANAQNSSDSAAMKKCITDYKKDKAECKKTFKASKKGVCAQIKHNFLETWANAFK